MTVRVLAAKATAKPRALMPPGGGVSAELGWDWPGQAVTSAAMRAQTGTITGHGRGDCSEFIARLVTLA